MCTIVYVHTILRDTKRHIKMGWPDAYTGRAIYLFFAEGNVIFSIKKAAQPSWNVRGQLLNK